MTARIVRRRYRLLATAATLPGPPITTEDLLQRITAHFGIPARSGHALARRLGVETRHHVRDWLTRCEPPRAGHRNPELAATAVAAALAEAGIEPSGLQYLIGHTTTPASLLPPNIAEVADRLHYLGPYAELRQACTGFANALQLASGLLATANQPVAIVGSETGSAFFDPLALAKEPDQWVNLMQMGDGAGAAILANDDDAPPTRFEAQSEAQSDVICGGFIESLFFGHIGLGRMPGFSLPEGGSDHPMTRPGAAANTFRHRHESVRADGEALFRAGLAAAEQAGIALDGLRYILPHQANGRIGDWLARGLGLPTGLFYGNGARVGNLGSASIWVLLHDLRSSGRLASGDRVLVLGAEATKYLYGGFVYTHG